MTLHDLPAVNATLNGLSTIFILCGWYFIRRDFKREHIACMTLALFASTLFLVCYLLYHFHAGSVRFTAQGPVRFLYFTVLLSHTLLAVAVLPLVIMTVVPALRTRFDRHRRIGRWTMPVWLYVSVTGVLVYMMLYQWFPPANLPSLHR